MAEWVELDIPFEEAPKGYRRFALAVSVKGTSHYLREAKAWINSSDLSLDLEREPHNEHDENAIKVIGISKNIMGIKRRHIGYVDRYTATIDIGEYDLKRVKPTIHRIAVLKNFFGYTKAVSIVYDLHKKSY